jgi:hypothetical protein
MPVKAQAFESPEKQKADSLLAQTRPGYYTRQLVAGVVASVEPCNHTLCENRALPVTLVTFSGRRVDAGTVDLIWETSEEVNNAYFLVERTLNPSKGFETVAKVKGAGTSRTTSSYQAHDPNDFGVYTYYRLKQVDTDGSYEYSSIIAIKGNDAFFSVTAFPNPGRYRDLVFKVTGVKGSEPLSILVFDSQGRVVYQNDSYMLQSQEGIVKGILPDLLLGKYSIKIESRDRDAMTTFVVAP